MRGKAEPIQYRADPSRLQSLQEKFEAFQQFSLPSPHSLHRFTHTHRITV